MDTQMFCFQCEQTAGGSACTFKGVCGKQADTANLQDELTGALIALARAAVGKKPGLSTHKAVMEALFTTITNVNFNDETVQQQIQKINNEKNALLAGQCAENFRMEILWEDQEDIRSLKSLILLGLRGVAAYADHALVLGYSDDVVNDFFYEGLRAVGDGKTMEDLLPLVLKTGEINFKCMELLDRANTETYGVPVPVTVPLTIEKGPFIVVSGHDLHDLYLLLEQTKDKGINVYTHGGMLPCHGYPNLKAYPKLEGNFGTAW